MIAILQMISHRIYRKTLAMVQMSYLEMVHQKPQTTVQGGQRRLLLKVVQAAQTVVQQNLLRVVRAVQMVDQPRLLLRVVQVVQMVVRLNLLRVVRVVQMVVQAQHHL